MKEVLRENFQNPPSEYRTAPFWSWNGKMEKEELSFQMKDFKAHGIGGAFAHPRVGMITEYLSEEFFDAWRDTLECARQEGMKLYMYDENAWPSGFAGGKVAREDISTIGELARYKIVKVDSPEVEDKVFFAAEYLGDRVGRNLTELSPEEWKKAIPGGEVIVIYRMMPRADAWTGGYPYPDVTNPRTVEIFLRNTYEEYAKRFGQDFGSMIPAVFSDEANIHSEGVNTLPFAPHIRETFEKMHGYPLQRNLAAVFLNLEGDFDRPAEKVRYDYFTTLHEVWIENFIKPIASWCDKHGIAWTGHDVEHQWPQAHHGRISVSEQTTYEFRQWPAMDLLLCEDLRHTPTNYEKFQMYEIRSAANQFGKKRTLCEAYGAGGYDSTLADYKRLSDFLLVNGINFICQHLSLYSFMGARKRDCPQSFDYRQPWWNEYKEQADYLARASFMTAQGSMEQRLLVINPSTTGYLVPPEAAKGTIDHAISIDCIKNPSMHDFLSIISLLADEQWDFDLGDEYSMERNARVEEKKLIVGLQKYDTVLISSDMKNMRSQTVRLLKDFIEAGGTVLATGDSAAEYIDGAPNTAVSEELRALWTCVESPEELMKAIEAQHKARISSSIPFPTGFAHIRKKLDDGRICWFMVNHAMQPFEADLTVDGECAAEWDLFTGETRKLPCTVENGKLTFHVSLCRCESLCIVTGDQAEEKIKVIASEKKPLKPIGIHRESENTFTLDHVSLEADGKVYPPRYFIEATDQLFKLRGFEKDPWTTLQTGTEYIDRNAEFGEGSGFKAHYAFKIQDLPRKCRVVVERPEVMRVSVNDQAVEWTGEKGFIDRESGVFDIAKYLKQGENRITLSTEKFDVLCEIEAIFLQGDFAVEIQDNRFVMTKEKPVGMGNWLEDGMPFYSGAVIYRYETELENAPEAAVIELPEYEATAASVTVNGEYAGMIGRNGGNQAEISAKLHAGKNIIEVRVCGSFRNLLGPYLVYLPETPYDWNFFVRGREAGANEYMLCSYGLYKEPLFRVSK